MQLNEIYLALSSPAWKLTLSAGLDPFAFWRSVCAYAIIFLLLTSEPHRIGGKRFQALSAKFCSLVKHFHAPVTRHTTA